MSRFKRGGFRYLRTVSIRRFGGSVLRLLRKGEMRVPIFGFGAKAERCGNSFLRLSGSSVLIVRKVRKLGSELDCTLPGRDGFGVCLDTLARLGVSRRGEVPAASNHLVHEVMESTHAEKASTGRAVTE